MALMNPRDRAAIVILALGAAVAIALLPFLSGLLGAAVLYVIFVRPYRWMARRLGSGVAAALALVLALVVVALPLAWVVSLLVDQAPDAVRSLQSGTLIARARDLRIGSFSVGTELAKAGATLFSWLPAQAVRFVGNAATAVLNVLIAFFGLYFLLRSEGRAWPAVREYIPFSSAKADELLARFFSMTEGVLLGWLLVAITQGTVVGIGFAIVGLPDPMFWGTVTAFGAIIPLIGSGTVSVPAIIVLLIQARYGGAAIMLVVALVASNIDNVIRLLVYRRVSNIHPMITLVGVFAGIRIFGLLGLLLGPLAIAYLFELLRAYRQEYGDGPEEPALRAGKV
jgi:predicted PurR-regulated permease PerM